VATPDKATPTTAVRVQPGDTLSKIAKDNGLTLKEIRALNPVLMSNPKYDNGNMIFSNTKINIAPAAPKTSAATTAPATSAPATSAPATTTPVTTTPVTTTPVTTTPTTTDTTGANTDQTATGGGVDPGQVGGGGATGGMPGGATAFSGGFSQADIDKAFKSGQDAAAKVAADNAYAVKVKASDKLIATFKANGIDDPAFSEFISSQILGDVSTEDTLLKLYDQPSYKARFPGMAALRGKNRTITEDAYIKLENQIVETLRFFDLPTGFYDNRTMLGSIIGNEVSPKEVQDRAQAAQDLAKTTNPEIRTALKEFYNIGEGDITAHFLNGDLAGPLLLKQARAAEIAGVAKTAGFNAFGGIEAATLAEQDVYKNMNLTDLTTAIGKSGTLADTQRRLAYLEQGTYSDREALKATIESDQQAILASQRRASRETARFGGSSGLGAASLKTGSESRI
jgi:hypothetical protein